MKVVKFGKQINIPIVLCLGYFGCMHKGHMEILHIAQQIAKNNDSAVALFTFSNNHLEVLGKDDKVIYTFEERLQLYNSSGAQFIIENAFDERFRNLTGTDFLQVFVDSCTLKGVVCGFDYHCGSDRLDCNDVKKFFEGICPTQVVDEVRFDDVKVSTTLIKSFITNNKISNANSLLSEPYFICGKVCKGRGIGKTIGFPTANLLIAKEKLIPNGVFGGITSVDGKDYRCIVNIGSTPTFNCFETVVEVNLLEYAGSLYGQTLKIAITKFIRSIKKFASATDLAEQLNKDRETVFND